MVIRIVLGAALLAALASCDVSGQTCGLGRCQGTSTCTTLFNDTFTSKAAGPGKDIDHNYWCLGSCPSSKKCPGQCLEDPTDDSIVVCSGTTVDMKVACPSTLGATFNGSCMSVSISACEVGGTMCPANQTCDMGTRKSGTTIGPIVINPGSSQVEIDLSSLSHTTTGNPPLSPTLPQGVVPIINVPSTCSN